TPSTPVGCRPSMPPAYTDPNPESATAAPTSPPTSACPELEGSPRHHVATFHSVAARTPDPITATADDGATVTIPATVLATAVPTTRAPTTLKIADSASA